MDLSVGGVIFITMHLIVFKYWFAASQRFEIRLTNSCIAYRRTLGGMLLQLCYAVFMISIQILEPAVQKRCFEQLTLSEGFEANRHGMRALRVGIDARSVPMSCESEDWCSQDVCRTWLSEPNIQLNNLFDKLCQLLRFSVTVVFVFPRQGSLANEMLYPLSGHFQSLVEAFGFHYHMV